MIVLHSCILSTIILICTLVVNDGFALAQEATEVAPDAPQQRSVDLTPAARLLSTNGKVQIKLQAGDPWQPATPSQLAVPVAEIVVGDGGRATLVLDDGQILQVNENTLVRFPAIRAYSSAQPIEPVAYVSAVIGEVTLRRANGTIAKPETNDFVFWNDILEIKPPGRVLVTFRVGEGVSVELDETTIFDRLTLSSTLKRKLSGLKYAQFRNSSLLDDAKFTGSLPTGSSVKVGNTEYVVGRRPRKIVVDTSLVDAAVEG